VLAEVVCRLTQSRLDSEDNYIVAGSSRDSATYTVSHTRVTQCVYVTKSTSYFVSTEGVLPNQIASDLVSPTLTLHCFQMDAAVAAIGLQSLKPWSILGS